MACAKAFRQIQYSIFTPEWLHIVTIWCKIWNIYTYLLPGSINSFLNNAINCSRLLHIHLYIFLKLLFKFTCQPMHANIYKYSRVCFIHVFNNWSITSLMFWARFFLFFSLSVPSHDDCDNSSWCTSHIKYHLYPFQGPAQTSTIMSHLEILPMDLAAKALVPLGLYMYMYLYFSYHATCV